jgi:hypothetical protein
VNHSSCKQNCLSLSSYRSWICSNGTETLLLISSISERPGPWAQQCQSSIRSPMGWAFFFLRNKKKLRRLKAQALTHPRLARSHHPTPATSSGGQRDEPRHGRGVRPPHHHLLPGGPPLPSWCVQSPTPKP